MRNPSIELSFTVDDLPVHGPAHPELTRREIAGIFIDTFQRNNISSVVGFTNGGLTDPIQLQRFLRLTNRRVLRRLSRYLVELNIMDTRSYMSGQFPESSTAHTKILEDWVRAGHVLGNHNYWHSNLNLTDHRLFIKGIEKNEKMIARLNKLSKREVRSERVFRYPYLEEGEHRSKRDLIKQYLHTHSYTLAPVTVGFNDWAWNRSYIRLLSLQSEKRIERIKQKYLEMAVLGLKSSVLAAQQMFGRDIKHVLILHMGAFTAIMLDELVKKYCDLGVRFITVEQALEDEIYKRDPGVTISGKGRSFLAQWKVARNESPVLIDHSVYRDSLFEASQVHKQT